MSALGKKRSLDRQRILQALMLTTFEPSETPASDSAMRIVSCYAKSLVHLARVYALNRYRYEPGMLPAPVFRFESVRLICARHIILRNGARVAACVSRRFSGHLSVCG